MSGGAQSQTLQKAIQSAIDYIGLGKKKTRITDETVEAVAGDGSAYVKGEVMGTSGRFQSMKAGDKVKVLWSRTSSSVKKPKKNVIIAHQVRRNIPPVTYVAGGEIVEELFISGAEDSRDVYFRDYQQVTNLGLRDLGMATDPIGVKFGEDGNTFFTFDADYMFILWKLNHQKLETAFGKGSVATAELIRAEDCLASDITLTTVTFESAKQYTILAPVVLASQNFIEMQSGIPVYTEPVFSCGETLSGTGTSTALTTIPLILNRDLLLHGHGAFVDGGYSMVGWLTDAWLSPIKDNNTGIVIDWNLFLAICVSSDSIFVRHTGTTTLWTCTPAGIGGTPVASTPTSTTVEQIRVYADVTPFVINASKVAIASRGWLPTYHILDDTSPSAGVNQGFMMVTLNGGPSAGTYCSAISVVGNSGNPSDEVASCSLGSLGTDTPRPATGFVALARTELTGYVDKDVFVNHPGEPSLSGELHALVQNPKYVAYTYSINSQPDIPSPDRAWDAFDVRCLHWDVKDPKKSRLWIWVTRYDGPVTGVLQYAQRFVIVDGTFQFLRELVEYSEWWPDMEYNSGNGRHAIWAQVTETEEFYEYPPGFQKRAIRWNLYLSDIETGNTKLIGTDHADYTDRNFKVLGQEADLFYEAREIDGRKFIEGWDGEKKPILEQGGDGYPAEDANMRTLGQLLDIPPAIASLMLPTQITKIFNADNRIQGFGPHYRGNNDKAVLSPRQRYTEPL